MMGYFGSIIGDLLCGFSSQGLRSRKRAILAFVVAGGCIALFHPLLSDGIEARSFYWMRLAIGIGNGYSAILVAWTAEMFGTNLRTTAASAVANLMRASVIPISFLFQMLSPHWGLVRSSSIIGGACFAFALIGIAMLPDTFDQDLRFLEDSSGQES